MSVRLEIAVLALLLALLPAAAAAQPVVTSITPVRHSRTAPVDTAISVTFDRAIQPASITASSFRVFGRWGGVPDGTRTLNNGNQTVTFTLDSGEVFSAGDLVTVTLSEAITAADTTTLRTEGYQWQFWIATRPVTANFQKLDEFSNRATPSETTRIYGALGADLNHDGWLDITTVNEVSADLRVFLNLANGSGLYEPDWQTPVAVGVEASPNESGDFNNDGDVDVAVSSVQGTGVWVALGLGDGNFQTAIELDTGAQSHGLGVLDADGDGDQDLVNALFDDSEVAIFLNNGTGIFSGPTTVDGGVGGEYGLGVGDMDNDGILDVVVGGLGDNEVAVLLGNGDGTFSPQPSQTAGGPVWQLAVGDVDGDGNLDVATANSFANTGSILRGNGDGTLDLPENVAASPGGGTAIASDLGDLDGDGDLDWVLSNFQSALWRVLLNDGNGGFTVLTDIDAPQSGSCAVLMDFDNDRDLDLTLIDELEDTVTLMENTGSGVLSPLCPPAPSMTCRQPTASGAAQIQLVDKDDTKDRLQWKWSKGAATTKDDYGLPTMGEGYALCLYDGGTLVSSAGVPPAGSCGGKPCWKEASTSYKYGDKLRSSDGVGSLLLKAGVAGKAQQQLKAQGFNVLMPSLAPLAGPLVVQLHQSSAAVCWGATFSAPFVKDDGVTLKDKSD